MSKVQTYGPKEGKDPETGDPRYVYGAEARGSDGQIHSISCAGNPTPYVEFQERFREVTGKALEQKMRDQGVWSDDEQG